MINRPYLPAFAPTLCMAYSTRASAALGANVSAPLLTALLTGCEVPACKGLLSALHWMATIRVSLLAFACTLHVQIKF